MVLAVSDRRNRNRGNCIIDSGASRHLINDETLLIDSDAYDYEIAMTDGESRHLTQVGSVRLKVIAHNIENTVMLMDMYLAPRIVKTIVLYGKLGRKGFALVYDEVKRTLVRRNYGAIAFNVVTGSNMRYFDVIAQCRRGHDGGGRSGCDCGCDKRRSGKHTVVLPSTFLGILIFVTIERMAQIPASGILMTSNKHMACVSGIKGKQTCNKLPQQNSDTNAPIDRVGGVIYLDLKGPMTPKECVMEWESQNGCCAFSSPLVPGRPPNGGATLIPCARPSSPCVPVGWANCTLLGGLESMLIRNVFGTNTLAVV